MVLQMQVCELDMKYFRKNGQPFDSPFRIEKGIDNSLYAVFENEFEAEDFAQDVLCRGDAVITCFGGFMNAVLLGEKNV